MMLKVAGFPAESEVIMSDERNLEIYFNDGSGMGCVTREQFDRLNIIDEDRCSGECLVYENGTYYVISRKNLFIAASSTDYETAKHWYENFALACTP